MGLDKYEDIMRQVNTVDVSRNADFQRQYNGFYIVRRNADWRKIYYELFETMKTEPATFAIIITKLFEKTGNIEASFSSKMLATLMREGIPCLVIGAGHTFIVSAHFDEGWLPPETKN